MQAAPAEDASHAWQVVAAGSGLYRVVDKASGLRLGIGASSIKDGAPVRLGSPSPDAGQLWQLIPDSSGKVKFANVGSGEVLGVADMSKDTGAAVIAWSDGSRTSGCSVTGPRSPGKVGTALDLCGSSAYINMPDGIVSGVRGDYTVSAWVNPAKNAKWSRILDIGDNETKNMFLTVNDGCELRFSITRSGAPGERHIDGAGTLPLNTWSLVTVTVAGTEGTLYVDGKVVGTNPDMSVHPADLGDTAHNYIGKSQYSDPPLDAAVDDVNIYNRALSADQVGNLAGGHIGDGDVLHYAFDGKGGATAGDSSGNRNDGTIMAGAPKLAPDSETPDHLWTLTPVPTTPVKNDACETANGKLVTILVVGQPEAGVQPQSPNSHLTDAAQCGS